MNRKTMPNQAKQNLFKNKWFIAFLFAAVLAIAAITVAIVLGVRGNDETPDVDNGAFVEEGDIYYYDTVEGEIVLTLYNNDTFTYATEYATKTGSYTKDGDTVTLDFVKDSDGTATATFSGEKLLVVYDGATLPFIPRIEYTVTYGGTDMPSTRVVNGKTLKKPTVDPAKEGYVFFGWYADESLTVPYDFDSVIVNSDLTIYAKWVSAELFS